MKSTRFPLRRRSPLLAGALLSSVLVGSPPLAAATAPPGGGLSEDQCAELQGAFERMLAADFRSEFEAICKRNDAGEYARCKVSGTCDTGCDCMPTRMLLGYQLLRVDGTWDVVQPLIEERFESSGTTDVQKRRMLDLLATTPSETSQALAEKLWKGSRESFTSMHVVALAESSHDEDSVFFQQVRSLAKKDVRAAALLATRGDDRGKQTLARTVKRAQLDQGAADYLVAAYALGVLGDETVWQAALDNVTGAALDALDAGDLERARVLALDSKYISDAVDETRKRSGPSLAYLDVALEWSRLEHASEVVDPDQVFELIEGLES